MEDIYRIEDGFKIINRASSIGEPEDISEIVDDVCYSKTSIRKIKTSSNRFLDEALTNHPSAPAHVTEGRTRNGKYYLGSDLKHFFETLIKTDFIIAPPWATAVDKQAEHTDIVARIMNELDPHISNAIRKVLFEEMNSNA